MEDETLAPAWRPQAGQLPRCREGASAMAPLAVSLGRSLAGAILARGATRQDALVRGEAGRY